MKKQSKAEQTAVSQPKVKQSKSEPAKTVSVKSQPAKSAAAKAGPAKAKLAKSKSGSAKQTISGSWYDYPQYYDLAFADDTMAEADFIQAICAKYCDFPVQSFVEPACGSGRLVAELAKRGHEVTGIDLAGPALEFLRKRTVVKPGSKKKSGAVHIIQGDMADFTLPQPVDVGYCLVNSFRHLLTESAAESHFKSMSRALRPGGLYILGLHLLPLDAEETAIERWKVTRGKTEVGVDLRVSAFDRRKRVETLRVSLRAKTGEKHWHLRGEFDLRLYTLAQLRKLLATVPEFEICGSYDFWYQLDEPQKLNNEISDVVLILRKRA